MPAEADRNHLSARVRRQELDAEAERAIDKVLREVIPEGLDARSTPASRSASGHHSARRRGVPIIGKGISGALPGTRPGENL